MKSVRLKLEKKDLDVDSSEEIGLVLLMFGPGFDYLDY